MLLNTDSLTVMITILLPDMLVFSVVLVSLVISHRLILFIVYRFQTLGKNNDAVEESVRTKRD